MSKFRCIKKWLFTIAGFSAVIQSAPALATVISDGAFNNTNWIATVLDQSGPPVSFNALQIASGGNPGEYRQVQHSYGGPGWIITGHLYQGAQYDPATQGAISDVSYAFDLMLLDGGASLTVGYGVLLLQAGDFFWTGSGVNTTIAPITNVWVNHILPSYSASDFLGVTGSGAHPDFSAAGSPILFGYFASNGTAGSSPTSTLSGIDNWSVTITPTSDDGAIPEPSSISLLLAAGLGLSIVRIKVRREKA